MMCKKIRECAENNILKIAMWLLIPVFILSSILQIAVLKFDLSSLIKINIINNIYSWITSPASIELLDVIDGFSVVFGIVAFFLDEWVRDDKENIVFVLIIIISLAFAHILKLLSLHIISFSICIAVIILIIFPFWFMIENNLNKSERRTKKRNAKKKR